MIKAVFARAEGERLQLDALLQLIHFTDEPGHPVIQVNGGKYGDEHDDRSPATENKERPDQQ